MYSFSAWCTACSRRADINFGRGFFLPPGPIVSLLTLRILEKEEAITYGNMYSRRSSFISFGVTSVTRSVLCAEPLNSEFIPREHIPKVRCYNMLFPITRSAQLNSHYSSRSNRHLTFSLLVHCYYPFRSILRSFAEFPLLAYPPVAVAVGDQRFRMHSPRRNDDEVPPTKKGGN